MISVPARRRLRLTLGEQMDNPPEIQDFSRNRLRGQPLPADLAILLANRDALNERVGLEMSADPNWEPWSDTSYLSGEELANPDIPANIKAMTEVCKYISFVAATDESEYYGYWRGGDDRVIADSPVVCLDNEGQFELCCGRTFADAILSRNTYDDDDFADFKSWLTSLGVDVGYDSLDSMPVPVDESTSDELHEQLYDQFLANES